MIGPVFLPTQVAYLSLLNLLEPDLSSFSDESLSFSDELLLDLLDLK